MALIPPSFLDCVVAIGCLTPDGRATRWLGTGFLVGHEIQREGDNVTHRIYLVTNRHVLTSQVEVQLRFNPEGSEPARQFQIPLQGNMGRIWFVHPSQEIDIAVVPLDAQALKNEGIRFSYFWSGEHVLTRDRARELGVSEGDQVYVLGFPMGIVGGRRSHVIVRQGCLARVRDALAGDSNEFLVDASVFPGNSGGPVITRPELISVQGTSSIHKAYLIAMVKAYIPYEDRAISPQTGTVRVVFMENSGLAAAIPYDFIAETIGEHLKVLAVQNVPEASVSESDIPVEPMGAEESVG